MTTRDELFNSHLDLAERIAREVAHKRGRQNGLDVEDYRQAALLGLWEAAGKFDPENGAKFESYARPFMKRRIYDEIRHCDDVGRSRRADGIKGSTVSLDMEVADSSGKLTFLREMISAPALRDQSQAYSSIRKLLACLDDRAKIIVFLCDVLELAPWMVGDVLDLPESFVGYLRVGAFEKLKKVDSQPKSKRRMARRFGESRIISSCKGVPCGTLFGSASNN